MEEEDDFDDSDEEEEDAFQRRTTLDFVDEAPREAEDLEEALRLERLELQQLYPHLVPQGLLFRPRKARRRDSCYRREAEQNQLLPFRIKRFEKVNNNGEEKQLRAETKRVRVNERVKKRQR